MDRVTIILAAAIFTGVFSGAMWLAPKTVPAARPSRPDAAPPPPPAISEPSFPRRPVPDFDLGEWEMKSYLGTSIPTSNKDVLSYQKCLRADDPQLPVKDNILALIGRNNCKSDTVMIGGGGISGTLTCPGAYDVREHPERLSGYYNRRAVHVVIGMGIFGTSIPQTLDYRRIGECPAIPPPKPASGRIVCRSSDTLAIVPCESRH